MTTLALDTSVAVPYLMAAHEAHRLTRRRLADRELVLTQHSLAETYSVLTRLPGDARVAPADVVTLLDAAGYQRIIVETVGVGQAEVAIAGTALGRSISLEGERVLLDGRDVTAEIRSSEVTEAASVVAVVPEVRELLVSSQRGWASGRNVVTEGRDQGTIVFPDAMCKFFLTADPAERAARRQRELQEAGQPVSLDEMLGLIHERDERDATRETGPLVAAEDAAVIDTTGLTMEEVVELLEDRVRQRMAQQQQQ